MQRLEGLRLGAWIEPDGSAFYDLIFPSGLVICLDDEQVGKLAAALALARRKLAEDPCYRPAVIDGDLSGVQMDDRGIPSGMFSVPFGEEE